MSTLILIIGESGRGKTRLTKLFALALSSLGGPELLTVLDFAPGYGGVGRPMEPPRGARYVRPPGLRAPRLESRGDCGAAWRLAGENATLTSQALRDFIASPTPALVVNDATIHLHAGSMELLLEAVNTARVAVLNAYKGSTLRDECGIWEAEARAVEALVARADGVWRL